MGEGDPRYAYSLEKLGEVLLNLKRFDHAEPLMLRAHTLKLKILGPEHMSVAATLNNLSKLYYFQGKYEQAEPLAKQFVRICERNLGTEHPDVGCGIHNLATLYHVNHRYDLAEEQYKRALAICRKTLGNEHASTLRLLKSYAALLKTLNREQEAEHLDACAQGTITGSWKIIKINTDDALHQD
jgi:tetratricopeptide (TPR) repeat protein